MTKSVYKFTFVLFFSLSLTQLRGRTGINYHKKSVFKLVWLFCREREYFFWNEPEQFYRRDALPSTTVEEMAFLLVYAAHSTGANSQEKGNSCPICVLLYLLYQLRYCCPFVKLHCFHFVLFSSQKVVIKKELQLITFTFAVLSPSSF